MKKIVIPILILGVIGAGIGYYNYNKPVASLEHSKPEVEVSASQLMADYEADEKKANDMYLGKVVQVSGKVAGITTEEGKTKISLETPNPMSNIVFEMETGTETTTLKPGDEAKLKGKCSGYLSDVIMVQSSIAK